MRRRCSAERSAGRSCGSSRRCVSSRARHRASAVWAVAREAAAGCWRRQTGNRADKVHYARTQERLCLMRSVGVGVNVLARAFDYDFCRGRVGGGEVDCKGAGAGPGRASACQASRQ
jgi:hypothetical protein